MMKIEHFLMKPRTERQIMENYGNDGLEVVRGLEKLHMVKSRTENNENVYRMNIVSRAFISLEPSYWAPLIYERIKTL